MLRAPGARRKPQATTAWFIAAGLGRAPSPRDIALVHGARLATFYAFSGNARNLILITQAFHSAPSSARGSRCSCRSAWLRSFSASAVRACDPRRGALWAAPPGAWHSADAGGRIGFRCFASYWRSRHRGLLPLGDPPGEVASVGGQLSSE